MKELPVADIFPNPRNPRQYFDEDKVAELAESIREQGLLQPVLVRPVDDGYELVHGERRLRATKKLDRDTIKAEIRDLDDKAALEISITENLQREDVNPVEEARGYESLIDEFDLTQAEAAEKLGVSRSHISNQLGLLKLPEYLQQSVLYKTLSPWQARTLNSVWGEYWLFDLTIDRGLSVNELREVIDQLERGSENITVTRDIPAKALEDCVVTFVDLDERGYEHETICDIKSEEIHQWHLWARNNIDGYDEEWYDGRDDEFEVTSVVFHVVEGEVLRGSIQIQRALEEGYDGKMEVDLMFPRDIFEWDKRVPARSSTDEEAEA